MSSSDGFTGGPFETVAIWGVGLIGGSIGMSIRRAGLARRVIGIGRRSDGAPAAEPLAEAVRLGAIDCGVTDPAAALALADLVILAMPVGAMIELAPVWGPQIRPGTVVTDVGSTKAAVVAAWEAHLARGAHFVGGHPMFGRERSGVAHASADLVRGCRWALTPGPDHATGPAVERVVSLVSALGARAVVMSPEAHDRKVAAVSHLPQLAATALAAAALDLDERTPGTLDLAAGGFRDTTRIADSPADLWSDIWLTNPEALQAATIALRNALADLEAAIEAGDRQAIAAIFGRAQEARRRAFRPE